MNRQHGFSLVELMITLAIVGILAAIAYPGYSNHMKNTRRNLAVACLQENAQLFERWYTTNLTYEGVDAQSCADIESFYTVSESDVSAGAYTLTAEPKGAQATDKCGKLELDQAGRRTSDGDGADGCW